MVEGAKKEGKLTNWILVPSKPETQKAVIEAFNKRFGLSTELTSTNVVVSSSIYLIWEQPNQPQAASLSMMMVGALLALVIPIQIYITRKLDRFG